MPIGWFVNPSEERTALAVDLLARESLYRYRAYTSMLEARQMLRERMEQWAGKARQDQAQVEDKHG